MSTKNPQVCVCVSVCVQYITTSPITTKIKTTTSSSYPVEQYDNHYVRLDQHEFLRKDTMLTDMRHQTTQKRDLSLTLVAIVVQGRLESG